MTCFTGGKYEKEDDCRPAGECTDAYGVSGCGQNTDGGNAVQKNEITAEAGNTGKDELVFVNYRDIRDLNPHLYAGEMYAQSILYDTLVSSAEDGYKAVLLRTGRLVRTGVHIPLISGTVCIFRWNTL